MIPIKGFRNVNYFKGSQRPYAPFRQKILAMKRLFFPGPSSMATSHLSIVVTLSRSLVGSPPVRVRKTERRAFEGG